MADKLRSAIEQYIATLEQENRRIDIEIAKIDTERSMNKKDISKLTTLLKATEEHEQSATRIELLKTLKVIKEHCKVSDCNLCEIEKECGRYLNLIDNSHTFAPCNWDLEDGEPNE